MSGYLDHYKRGPLRTKEMLDKYGTIGTDLLIDEDFKKKHPKIGYDALKRIIEKNDVDFFIHSWEVDNKDLINEIYKPKRYIYEKQINFGMELKDYGVETDNLNIKDWKVSNNAKLGYKYMIDNRLYEKKYTLEQIMNELEIQTFRVSSRFYSIKKSIELKNEYEKKEGIKYDFVLVLRFGVDWTFKYNFDYNNLPREKFIMEGRFGRIDQNISANDLWFLGNSDNIKHLASYFDNRKKYCTRPPIGVFEHLLNTVGPKNIKLIH